MKLKFPIFIAASIFLNQTISAQNWAQIGADIDGEAAGDL